jgi:hypothetical protein
MKTKVNPRHWVVVAVLAMVMILLFFQKGGFDLPVSSASPNVRASGLRAQVPGAGLISSSKTDDQDALRLIIKSFKGRQPALDSMIAKSADKVGAGVAAFFISLDPYYLEQLQAWPDSSICCLLIGAFDPSLENRAKWIQKLKKSDPDGAIAPLMEALLLLEGGKSEDARQAWGMAIQKRKVELPQQEIKSHIHSAWRELGYDDALATALTLRNTSAYSLSSIVELASGKIWNEQISSSRDEEELISAASQQMNFLDMIKRSRQPDSRMDITTMEMEKKILESLPHDAEFGRENFTVADRIGAIQNDQRLLGKNLEQFRTLYSQISPSNLSKYRTIHLLQGEQAARKWLIGIGEN